MDEWILYGANGYTGELIAREASQRGLKPILAGRNGNRISPLAAELGCSAQVFALSDVTEIVKNLSGVGLLLNCAGPFSATAAPLMEACLRAGLYYLDITGEIDVIEAAFAHSERAKQSGISLIPAVGFDVVPSDCLAALLAARLPDATRLLLAFTGAGRMSPGTTKTTIESLPKGGRVRINGQITRVPLVWKSREIPFAEGTKTAVTIPWGDVATAYYSTGIGNIEVYAPIPSEQLRLLRRWRWLLPLLRWGPLQRYVQRQVGRTDSWPDGRRADCRPGVALGSRRKCRRPQRRGHVDHAQRLPTDSAHGTGLRRASFGQRHSSRLPHAFASVRPRLRPFDPRHRIPAHRSDFAVRARNSGRAAVTSAVARLPWEGYRVLKYRRLVPRHSVGRGIAGGFEMLKRTLALSKVYRLLEPGPVVLLTTANRKHANVMAMSWHTMIDFEPPLVGMIVSNRNHTFDILKATKECVINIPTAKLAEEVVGCGNVSGRDVDKFSHFGLTQITASAVCAPLIGECFANLECRVVDTGMVKKYCLFIVQVIKAWIDPRQKSPRTLHHRGMGTFMVAGTTIKLPSRMK